MVVVETFSDLMQANLARAELESQEIPARVVETTSWNPLYVVAAGGHRLMVDPANFERAKKILSRRPTAAEVDTEPEGVVRCPRCELPYCYYGRPRARGMAPAAAANLITVILLFPVAWATPKRWRCERCEHVWSDSREGPRSFTALPEGVRAPTFRLLRRRTGMGLFLGLLTIPFLSVVAPRLALVVGVAAMILGFLIGHFLTFFVCSTPSCRGPIRSDDERCKKCRAPIAGRIDQPNEHYSASADYRRTTAEPKKPARRRPAAAAS